MLDCSYFWAPMKPRNFNLLNSSFNVLKHDQLFLWEALYADVMEFLCLASCLTNVGLWGNLLRDRVFLLDKFLNYCAFSGYCSDLIVSLVQASIRYWELQWLFRGSLWVHTLFVLPVMWGIVYFIVVCLLASFCARSSVVYSRWPFGLFSYDGWVFIIFMKLVSWTNQ